jgi:epsilon-lactone hydrolase
MISRHAEEFWDLFRRAPVKQIDMPLAVRREAGEHAEDVTVEPNTTKFTDEPEVDGLWANPEEALSGAAILYLFGGGYVLGSPGSRRKTAGHLAEATKMRVLVPNYRLARNIHSPLPSKLQSRLTNSCWRQAPHPPGPSSSEIPLAEGLAWPQRL